MLGLSFLEWAAGAGLGAKSAVDRQAATDADAYRLNGKPISAGDFMRHKTRDTAGNSAERIMLERKHLDLAKPGLREWVAGSIHGAGFQSLRPLVRVSHLVDVSNPDPGKWHYLRLGDMQKAVTLSNNSLSSRPIPAVVAQTKSAYLDVLQTGEPSIELIRREAGGDRLDFVRAIVREPGRRLRVGIDYRSHLQRYC